jgi:hypothetical protein
MLQYLFAHFLITEHTHSSISGRILQKPYSWARKKTEVASNIFHMEESFGTIAHGEEYLSA